MAVETREMVIVPTGGTLGDLVYFSGGTWARLALGSQGYIPVSATGTVQYVSLSTLIDLYLSGEANGDQLTRASGTWTQLALGAANKVVGSSGGVQAYISVPLTSFLTADQKLSDLVALGSTTVQTSSLSIALSASTNYIIDGFIPYVCDTATPDIKWQWAFSGTTTKWQVSHVYDYQTSTDTNPNYNGDDAIGTAYVGTHDGTSSPRGIRVKGSLMVGASGGNLVFKFAQNTSSATDDVTLQKGAYIAAFAVS